MKLKLLLLIFGTFICLNSNAQFTYQGYIAVESISECNVHIADIDSDGDEDLLTSCWGHGVSWIQNNGEGSFSPPLQISGFGLFNHSLTADFDGDNDLDIVSVESISSDKIVYFENLGEGIFGSEQLLNNSVAGPRMLAVGDIDGDLDLDVLSISSGDDKLAYYLNDGEANFGSQQVISTSGDWPNSIDLKDLDGDNDFDIILSSSNDNKVAWYKNDGSANFGSEQLINSTSNGTNSAIGSDIDNDGDVDIVFAAYTDNKIAWHENDGNGNFGSEQIISNIESEVNGISLVDLNDDSLHDVVSWGYHTQKVNFYENSMGAIFGPQTQLCTTTDSLVDVQFMDIDGDNLDDAVVSWSNKIAWFKNSPQSATNVKENLRVNSFNIWPNPAQSLINYHSKTSSSIKIYDFSGRLIQVNNLSSNGTIDISNLEPGIYLVENKVGFESKKIITLTVSD